MMSCDQSFVTLAFQWEKLSKPQFYTALTRQNNLIEECSWFKLNNFGLALGMTLEFNTSVAKRLKIEVKEFLGLITTFVEVTGKNW